MKFASKICVPIQAKTMQELATTIKLAEATAEIIEIWLDQISDLNLPQLFSLTSKPLLVVNKDSTEKGAWGGSEAERVQLLINAAKNGAQFVDLGVNTSSELIQNFCTAKPSTTKLIISYHNFQATPDLPSLEQIYQQALQSGADIVKVATYCRNPEDVTNLLSLLTKYSSQTKMIVLGMGEFGKLTRITGNYLGNFLTFVPLNSTTISAPGQICWQDLQAIDSLINNDHE